jgi:hypothetical protein
MKVLIGRHKRCSIDISRDPACPAGGSAANVSIQVTWPYSGAAVRYANQQIPDTGGGLGGLCRTLPSPLIGRVTLQGNTATIFIPNVHDGDAYTLQITPA